MEKKTEYSRTPDGTVEKRETIRTTPEDGAVPLREIRPNDLSADNRGKYHAGYSTTKTYQSNNPQAAKLVMYGFCGLFLLVGIITMALGLWIFSLMFLGCAVFLFVGDRKRSKAAAKAAPQPEPQVSNKEVAAQLAREFQEDFRQSAQETFTDKRIHQFSRLAFPIYAVLVLVVSGLLGWFVSSILGIFVFLMLSAGGALYFLMLKVIGKACQKKD